MEKINVKISRLENKLNTLELVRIVRGIMNNFNIQKNHLDMSKNIALTIFLEVIHE